ncbi:3'-5' exonuclease [Paucibacter sp. XJ19-41]|uniref:3'-5' exonuclease n=1 Tax=Paucibacter sp. XJ19-41 TaxID=2927824 RepID=UPI00234ACEC3|nr:3'-5' exonuclease [Paucibacter sp. XJ19-41]MDC6166420.1 3'-5' exonuclease [Paucibacter sp. XJ19-41]
MSGWWQRLTGRGSVDAQQRWVVLDVETTGLDLERDRLLAIAAIAVELRPEPRILLGDSFEILLRQDEARPVPADYKANILLHGIGLAAQRSGVEPATALRAFEQWVGAAPLLAFHAAFDEGMIQREMGRLLGHRLSNRWLDLEPVAAVLHAQGRRRSLDEWMAHFGIRCAQRHQAAADTLATAELLLRLWPVLRERGETRFSDLRRIAGQRRWLAA